MIEHRPRVLREISHQIAAEEQTFIRTANQSEDGGADVQRISQGADAFGSFDHSGPEDDHWNLIGKNRDILAAINPGSMIGDDDEDGVCPKPFLPGHLKKLSKAPIRILHSLFAGAPRLVRILRYASAGIGE